MDFVDLQRRREERARVCQKPESSRRSVALDPLFLFGTGFVLGSVVCLFLYDTFYMSGFSVLLPFVVTIALLCYIGRLLLRRDPTKPGPRPGSEKQLLMAIQETHGITPVEAALKTSLTVDEADDILTRLAERGHLVVQSRDGALRYAMPGRHSTPGPGTT